MIAASAMTHDGTARWRRYSSPRSSGTSCPRSGWSTSCASGSIASSAAMNSASPATMMSGVVPRQVPYAHSPATTPSATTRPTREPGQRRIPCQSRRQHACAERLAARQPHPRRRPRPLLRELAVQDDHRPQVLDRGREAQRADQARAALGGLDRGAADAEQPDDRDREREDDARATAIGRTSSGQNASAPSIDAGEVIVPAATSSSDHATSATPIAPATSRPSRWPEATSALPHTATTAAKPVTVPAAIHSRDAVASASGMRCATSSPASAPPTSPTIATPRTWRQRRRAQHDRAVGRARAARGSRPRPRARAGRPACPSAARMKMPDRDDEPDDRGPSSLEVVRASRARAACRRRARPAVNSVPSETIAAM